MTSRSSSFGFARHQSTGMPSAVARRYRRMPQKNRECEAL